MFFNLLNFGVENRSMKNLFFFFIDMKETQSRFNLSND